MQDKRLSVRFSRGFIKFKRTFRKRASFALRPALADVYPGQEMRITFQLGNGEFGCAVTAAAGGKYRFETLQGYVEIDFDATIDRKGTHTAYLVADLCGCFFGRQHFCLCRKLSLILGVVDFRVSRRHDEYGGPFTVKDSVFAILHGSQSRSSAARPTVALEAENS